MKRLILLFMISIIATGSLVNVFSYTTATISNSAKYSIVSSDQALISISNPAANFTVTNLETIIKTKTGKEKKKYSTTVSEASISITNKMADKIRVTSFQGNWGNLSISAACEAQIYPGDTQNIPITLMGIPKRNCSITCTMFAIWDGGKASIVCDVPISLVSKSKTIVVK